MTFNLATFNRDKYEEILSRGLSVGLGERGKQVCIEAAICESLGLPHGDDPKCVGEAVRAFKIKLNDSKWSSSQARAKGLHDLGLAQLGSININQQEFANKISEKIIRKLLPKLFRDIFPNNKTCLDAADCCEKEGTNAAARAAYAAADDAYVANAAARAAYAAARAAANAASAAADNAYAAARAAANAASAARAAYAAADADDYLILAAELALETLKELNSPGAELL